MEERGYSILVAHRHLGDSVDGCCRRYFIGAAQDVHKKDGALQEMNSTMLLREERNSST